MKAGNFELKNIKHSEFASQETHCYQASLYLNGKKVAIVGNDGHGGGDRQDFVSKDLEALAEAEIRSMRQADSERFSFHSALEFTCCDLVNAHLVRKDYKRLIASRVMYTVKGKKGIYQTRVAKSQGTHTKAAVLAHWVNDINQRPDTDVVLNLQPEADALQIFRDNT